MIALLSKITGFFSTYLLDLALAVIVALALWGGVQTHRLTAAQAKTVKVQTAWDLDKAQRTQVALAAEIKARAKEQAEAAKLKEVQDAYTTLQTSHASALAAQRTALAVNGRLRTALAAFAAGSGQVGPDSIAASNQRAAALGELLARALRSDAEHATAAETNGDAVRALLAAWPHDDDSIGLGKLRLGS